MITINTAQELRDSIGLEEADEMDRPKHRRHQAISRQGGHPMRDGNSRAKR